jgi:hypothetical protein
MSIYPETNDDDFQMKIFKKREFYYHKIPKRQKLEKYEDIENYRNEMCRGDFKLREQQIIPTNFLSPDTNYKGLLIMHGTGTGKTCTAISIAEQFKEQVIKYNTKIYVLTSGPNIRENFKGELLFCTGETYLKNKQLLEQLTDQEKDRESKVGVYNALQYYKILSYKTFYKKVLGEKIAEKKTLDELGTKIKTSYKKTDEGDYEREQVVDKITNMDNTILIVDEAHNITGNEYGEAMKRIIKNSKNLRIVLLSATPMKNLADDIIDILNFLRPLDEQIKREMVFTGEKNYQMKFKPGGEEYLRQMATGYISFFRGNIPYIFADRVDKGKIPEGLLFTPVIECVMKDFQLDSYNDATKNFDDTLDRASSAAANFVYPGLDSNNNLKGYHSNEGLNKVLGLLKNKDDLIKQINKKLFDNKIDKEDISNFISESNNKNITGNILKLKYLKYFSSKFYKCIKKLNKLVDGKKGAQTAFIYSNLVKAGGMELFAEALKVNGYLEYNEDNSKSEGYNISDNTLDSRTGLTYEMFKKQKKPLNEFHPATFIIITGGSDDSGEDIPEIKQKIIRQVFNNIDNKEGTNIKFVLGSKVMNEGITLENVREVHILDVHYNLGKVDQVIGRAIRNCKHMALINDKYRFPKVNVYRYVVSLNKGLSTDEVLYQKAELKYILVKRIERILKEVAVDCPLLLNGNKFPEEIEKYKGCHEPTLENVRAGKKICPALCDFTECDFKCHNKKLNDKYYDNKSGDYKKIDKKEIDHNTFNDSLAKSEIDIVKQKIKDLYKFKHVYLYKELDSIIRSSYKKEQEELFDNYFLDKALEDMMPRTENDFNNLKDTIYDKYNRAGYLIQRGKYYIFQPFDDNENIPLYYRVNYEFDAENLTPVKNYVENKYGKIKEKADIDSKEKKETTVKKEYDYESIMDYYEKRDENFIVGIISMNLNKFVSENDDIFKVRPPLKKSADKKRGTGIYSMTGAVCSTSKDKDTLLKIIKKLENLIDVELKHSLGTRENMCDYIKNLLLYLEKYSTSKDDNKITYIMVPANHKKYDFPFNLEDRIKFIITQVKNIVQRDFDYVVKKEKNGKFENINNLISYNIEIKLSKYIEQNKKELEKIGFKFNSNNINILLI